MRKQTNKRIRLTESDLHKIVRRVIKEQSYNPDGMNERDEIMRQAILDYVTAVDHLDSAIGLFEMLDEELPEELDNLFGGQGNESLYNLSKEAYRLMRDF